MQKKGIIAALSVTFAMVVASLALVFTVGPMVSADARVGYLDKAEYFVIEDGVLGREFNGGGLSEEGKNYADQFDELHVVIPNEITEVRGRFDGRQICSIFFGCEDKIVSVELPQTLKTINNAAFANCYNLTEITIPDSVTNIGYYAFYNCSNLTSITIPYGVDEIHTPDPFAQCSNLTEIIVENEDLLTNESLAQYTDILRYEAPQAVTDPVDPEPETPVENDDENQIAFSNRKNNNALLAWIGGGIAAGLVVAGTVVGIIIAKKCKQA